jgi:hypothetical protein
MNTQDLLKALRKNRIMPEAYSIVNITAPPHDEQYVLTKERNMWVIYFEERGERTYEMFYMNEDEACRSFLDKILKDPSTLIR